jgi:aminoglycoside-2''-adenylyltransferase
MAGTLRRKLQCDEASVAPGRPRHHGAVRDFSTVDAAILTTDPEEIAFERAGGPWAHLTVGEGAELLAGFQRPWWVVGGHAIEAFTGVTRDHHDLDIAFFRSDLPALRQALTAEYDLWSVGSGLFRLIDDNSPDLHDRSSQIWVRRHAWSPWLTDLLATPDENGRWIHKRDRTLVADLAEVTWTDADGIRYLAPELVLTFKAHRPRPQDEADFTAAVGRLGPAARARLRSFLQEHYPEHAWLAALG